MTHALKARRRKRPGYCFPQAHTYTWRKKMAFITSTLIVDTGLWDALKTRTQKFGKNFAAACVRYGTSRARSAMNMHNLGMYYDN